METFERLRREAPNLPLIVLTGNPDDDLAVQILRQGAQDYLLKDEATGPLLAKAIRGLLYGVEPTDVTTFIAVIMLLLGASILAAFVPARRATHIDPIEALRRD